VSTRARMTCAFPARVCYIFGRVSFHERSGVSHPIRCGVSEFERVRSSTVSIQYTRTLHRSKVWTSPGLRTQFTQVYWRARWKKPDGER